MASAQGTYPSRDLVPPFPFPSSPARFLFASSKGSNDKQICSSEVQRTSLIFKFQTHFWCTEISNLVPGVLSYLRYGVSVGRVGENPGNEVWEIRGALSWSCNRVHDVSVLNIQEEILASNVTTKHLESFETNINLHFWRLKVKIRDPHFDDLPSGTGSSVVGASVGSVGSTGSKMWNKWRIEVMERNSNTLMTRHHIMTQWTNSEQMGVKC